MLFLNISNCKKPYFSHKFQKHINHKKNLNKIKNEKEMYSFLTTKKIIYIAAYVGQRFQFKGKCNKKHCTTLPTYTFLFSTNTCKIQKSLKVSGYKKAIELPILDILFPSNHNIHKSLCGHCFWASDPLIERFQ